MVRALEEFGFFGAHSIDRAHHDEHAGFFSPRDSDHVEGVQYAPVFSHDTLHEEMYVSASFEIFYVGLALSAWGFRKALDAFRVRGTLWA